jgi:hypothetical protein
METPQETEPNAYQLAALEYIAKDLQAERDQIHANWPNKETDDAHAYWRDACGNWQHATTCPDTYEAIAIMCSDLTNENHRARVSKPDAIAIVCYGWASPLTEGDNAESVRPSQHHARRRVRLVSLLDEIGHASRVDFFPTDKAAGEIAETVNTTGGQGQIADTLAAAFAVVTQ